jgi:DNA-binding transcriptional ArsR family regulator
VERGRPARNASRALAYRRHFWRITMVWRQPGIEGLTQRNDITKIIDMKTDYTRSIPPEWRPMSRVFTALGDEHRQRILMLFDKGERLNVGQIAAVSTLTRSTVSHHLKILREADVLCSEKIGKEVWFWINRRRLEETLGDVLDYVRAHC